MAPRGKSARRLSFAANYLGRTDRRKSTTMSALERARRKGWCRRISGERSRPWHGENILRSVPIHRRLPMPNHQRCVVPSHEQCHARRSDRRVWRRMMVRTPGRRTTVRTRWRCMTVPTLCPSPNAPLLPPPRSSRCPCRLADPSVSCHTSTCYTRKPAWPIRPMGQPALRARKGLCVNPWVE